MSLFNDASLVMIPSGYKTSKVYSVKPTDGTGDLSFTRSNDTATRVASNGLIEKVRTNLVLNSATFVTQTIAVGANPHTLSFTGTGTIVATGVGSGTLVGTGASNRVSLSFTTTAGNLILTLTGTATLAQLETGDIATDYIATTSAAVSVGPVANVPRLDYLGSSCPRLLLEPQRTNNAQYSEQLNNAWYTKNNQSVTANNTTAPDGYSSADLLIPAAGTGDHYILSDTVSTTASQVVTLSLFIKKKDHDYFYFGTGGASAFGAVVYQFSTNTFTLSGLSATATNYGNGWIRLTITGTTCATDLRFLFTPTDATGTRTFNANGTDGTWVWGMQAETAASYATSYIPTLGAAVTRGADAASKTGISSLIGQTEGTIFYDGYFGNEATEVYLFLQNGASSGVDDSIYLQKATNAMSLNVFNGSTQQSFISGGTFTIGQRVKIAAAYKANDFVLYVNGVQLGTDNTGSVPTCSALQFASYRGLPTTAEYINVKGSNQALLFKTRLTNAQLAELTTI